MSDDLLTQLRALYLSRDMDMDKEFNRSLPFADSVLGNRWDRASRLGFGEGVSIYDSALVFVVAR